VPAGAEQERVAADIGPGPAAEVLAHLLNGSRFNFLIVNSASDARVPDRVILSPRGEGGMARASAPVAPAAADDTNAMEPPQPQAAPEPTPPPSPAPAPQLPPGTPPDINRQENDPPD
jgi:hypothetical protein